MYDMNKLLLARLEKGLSVPNLAKKAGVRKANIYRYEREGTPTAPEVVAAVAQALGREPKEFIREDILRRHNP